MMFALSAKATGEFKRVVRIMVTDTTSAKMDAVAIEVEGSTIYTDQDGVAILDVSPGKYSIKVCRIACKQETFEIEVTEKTGFISLNMVCQ